MFPKTSSGANVNVFDWPSLRPNNAASKLALKLLSPKINLCGLLSTLLLSTAEPSAKTHGKNALTLRCLL